MMWGLKYYYNKPYLATEKFFSSNDTIIIYNGPDIENKSSIDELIKNQEVTEYMMMRKINDMLNLYSNKDNTGIAIKNYKHESIVPRLMKTYDLDNYTDIILYLPKNHDIINSIIKDMNRFNVLKLNMLCEKESVGFIHVYSAKTATEIMELNKKTNDELFKTIKQIRGPLFF